MIGFEWTAIGGYNLHRNVVFRGDAGVANQTLPFSQFDSKNPEDLWSYMAEFETRPDRRCWRFRTTATSPTGACSPSRRSTASR